MVTHYTSKRERESTQYLESRDTTKRVSRWRAESREQRAESRERATSDEREGYRGDGRWVGKHVCVYCKERVDRCDRELKNVE
jgi:hypothetical protein